LNDGYNATTKARTTTTNNNNNNNNNNNRRKVRIEKRNVKKLMWQLYHRWDLI